MIALETLQHSHFAPLAGQPFTLKAGGQEVQLTLAEARLLGHRRADATREPFSLTFRGLKGWRVPQGIYSLSHESLGEMELFLTQTGDTARGSEFEAVFT